MADSNTHQSNINANRSSITQVEVDSDAVLLHQADNASNADLYVVTPPAYTLSIAEGERSVDAEATRDEKSSLLSQRQLPGDRSVQETGRTASAPVAPISALVNQEYQHQTDHQQTLTPTQPSPPPAISHYLIQPYVDAALVGARPCSILHDRPATFLVKRKKIALCSLVAIVLVNEGLIAPKQLDVITQHAAARREPTDPLSGVILGTYDVVGEMMLGLVAGPVELGRQSTGILLQRASDDGMDIDVSHIKHRSAPKLAGKVVIEQGKGLCRIFTAAAKSPALLSHGITRGFHNMPKLYGEKVREYENVTGFRSGLEVCAKSFGYGLSDGFIDLFAKPVQGAEENGFVGFTTGVAKGMCNAALKPAAGAFGVVGYSSLGVYKSIRKVKLPPSEKEDNASIVQRLGVEEYERATDGDKLYIVRYWCQTMMRSRY